MSDELALTLASLGCLVVLKVGRTGVGGVRILAVLELVWEVVVLHCVLEVAQEFGVVLLVHL